ncbi:DgyrCDS1970 [Dimorphilus gyrociliatus]|nr:DgyrCDS1970 [Dimorphilus gyrociliatus]
MLQRSDSSKAVDLYLKSLLAVHSEVVDRDIARSNAEMQRNTVIKDNMRMNTVPVLVNSWYEILRMDNVDSQIVCQCLDVIGSYISWIDIDLIANDRFVPIILQCLGDDLKRESACDCLREIVLKGMQPLSKLKLIDSLTEVLDSLGVFTTPPQGDDVIDFLAKLAKLLNAVGLEVLAAYTTLVKANDIDGAALALKSLEDKISKMFPFIAHEVDDVSGAVCPLAQEYVALLKTVNPQIQEQHSHIVKTLLYTCIKRMKFDQDYDWDVEGEEEAIFQDYRRRLRNVVLHIGSYKPETILEVTTALFHENLLKWKEKNVLDVELALYIFYALLECLPSNLIQQTFDPDRSKSAGPLQQLALTVVESDVFVCDHPAVSLLYYESVARYDKLLTVIPEQIPIALKAFLYGVKTHPNPKVRTRVAYLLTRLVKSINKSLLVPYVDNLLASLTQDLSQQDSDALFVYEACGLLIIQSVQPLEKKNELLKELLSPRLHDVNLYIQRTLSAAAAEEQATYGKAAVHSLLCIVRTSKGFSEKCNMKATKCDEVYTHVLKTVLTALDTIQLPFPIVVHEIFSAVRQLLHRMIVCLEDSVLPFVVPLLKKLVEGGDVRELHDVMALCSQLVTKFKERVTPLFNEALMPLTSAVLNTLESPPEAATDDERKVLRRSHLNFVLVLATHSDFKHLLSVQANDAVENLLSYIVKTAMNPENGPQAQKISFCILKKFMETLIGNTNIEIVQQLVIRPCFEAPLCEGFNLSDAQTVLALTEAGQCAKTAVRILPDLLPYLRDTYLPNLGLSDRQAKSLCDALTLEDPKMFKTVFRDFFINARFQGR